jgi:hypothetical protein
MRFLSRKHLQRDGALPGAHLREAQEASREPVALQIEELEPRLAPDYTGGTGNGGSGTPGYTVGWGC